MIKYQRDAQVFTITKENDAKGTDDIVLTTITLFSHQFKWLYNEIASLYRGLNVDK